MDGYSIADDETSVEILKKAFVWYYRVWSYYWRETPAACVIHPSESLLELPNEVVCLRPRGASDIEVRRLQVAYTQPLTLIAPTLPAGQRGYGLDRKACREPSPWLSRFLAGIATSYPDLREAVSSGRTRERDRQEWRFMEAGSFVRYRDRTTERICLTPAAGSPYTFTLIRDAPDEVYFTSSKKGPVGRPTERGEYRRHKHEARRQIADNLDLFPVAASPVLWRFVQAGRGFKAFVRKSPAVPDPSR